MVRVETNVGPTYVLPEYIPPGVVKITTETRTEYVLPKNVPPALVKITTETGTEYVLRGNVPPALVEIITETGTEYVLSENVPRGSTPCSSGGSSSGGSSSGGSGSTGSSAAVPGTTSDGGNPLLEDGEGDSESDGEGDDGGDSGCEAEDGGGAVGDAVVLATGKGKGRRNGPEHEFAPHVQPRLGQFEIRDPALISANLLEQAEITSKIRKIKMDVRGLTYLQMEDAILEFERTDGRKFPYTTFEKLVTANPELNGIQEGAEGTTLTSLKFGKGRVVSSRRQEPRPPQKPRKGKGGKKGKKGKKIAEVANKTQTVLKGNRVFTIRYGNNSGTDSSSLQRVY